MCVLQVLRAKEIVLPVRDSSDTSDDDNGEGGGGGSPSGPWQHRRLRRVPMSGVGEGEYLQEGCVMIYVPRGDALLT